MSAAQYRIRRATLDDLPGLSALWRAMEFVGQDLEKRLTEFQVAEDPDGKVVAAVALEVQGQDGCLHHETFGDFTLADVLRPRLWERIETLANNLGLLRIWTQESAPFWRRNGLTPPSDALRQKLPEPWRQRPGDWLVIQLREELPETARTLERELEMFIQAERARTEQALRQARLLKAVVTLLAFAFAALVFAGTLYVMRQSVSLPPP